ncbi:MAG: DUF1566 domain-containing protein [Deltaproteobacteria bacterium]|nr:DUF1566 domain-containing protein [Deltaproteobacteria bacterium]
MDELKSLVHDDDGHFSRPGNPFTGVRPDGYWSSSTYADSTGRAWGVHLYGGGVGADDKTLSNHAWPVRGGQ